MAENIFPVLRFITTDHGNAAGHKFAKVISGRTQNPELRRVKTRILFGHGHAPGADVAGNIYFALGHGIGTSVADIAMHHDLSSGIQPSHIIGCRPVDLDRGIGKSHGSDTLSGLADDFNLDRFITGPPQSSADAMLAVSLNSQVPVSLLHCRLNLFFNNPRINTLSGNFPGNLMQG